MSDSQDKSPAQALPPEQLPERPGSQADMALQPEVQPPVGNNAAKLKDKVALISGGDSGIGRAVALAFAQAGADVALCYLVEDEDAAETKRLVESYGRQCLVDRGDIGEPEYCRQLAGRVQAEIGAVQILVNNAAEQHPQPDLLAITSDQLQQTFRTNVFGMFYLTQACLPQLEATHGVIINTTSVTAYKGSPHLLDYSATKGAIVAFTRSLSQQLVGKGIRVNAVAPGPIWTPLIPSTFPPDKVEQFGQDVPMQRPGQPAEVAPAYVFLASADSTYMTGQVLHINGGTIVNG